MGPRRRVFLSALIFLLAAWTCNSGSVDDSAPVRRRYSLDGNRGGTGSASVTVHGSSLGLVAFTALGRMGQTGCEGTEWESETSVRCRVGQGIRGTRRVAMTAGYRTQGLNGSALVLAAAPSSLRLSLCLRAQMLPNVLYVFSFQVRESVCVYRSLLRLL